MWNIDTHDEAAVARSVEHLIFDIQTDPEGAYLLEPAPAERAYVASPESTERLVILTPAGPIKANAADLVGVTSRTALRAILVGILTTRETTTDPTARGQLNAMFVVGSARYQELVARDGA